MTQFTRLRFGLLIIGCLALSGTEALAIDNGACCVQSTSRLETLLNPNKGSDESFFSSAGGPPNVLFLLDTSCSMNDWPEPWPDTRGCAHPTFAGKGYDPGTDYPAFVSGMTGPPGSKVPTYNNNWFNDEKVYQAGDNFGHDFSNSGGPTGTSFTGTGATPALRLTAAMATACSAVTAVANQAACNVCLQTAGYFVEDATTRIGVGNYFEYYSPRDVTAILTLSSLVFGVREIRLGIMTFDNWGGPCYDASSSPPLCLWQELSPSCNKLYPLDQSSVENNRNSILNALSGNNPFTTSTPLASFLYLAGYHLRSKTPDSFSTLFASAFPGNTTLDESSTLSQHSICSGCSFNAAIILTDGSPNGELFTLPPEITSLTAATAPYCTSGVWCGGSNSYLDEVAYFLAHNDLRNDIPGKQVVNTYTIGFATGADENALLIGTAKSGGGKFYPANGAAAIKAALLEILDDIASRNNTFASAAIASVQTGASSTPALLPRMLPRKGQPWEGKLWRFEQWNEFVKDSDLNGDGDKEDVFVVENVATPTAANIVVESADGTFVKSGTSTPALPYWEGNNRLVTNLSVSVDNRKVWTVFDTNGDGSFTNADTLTRFVPGTAAEDLKMAEYMGIRGTAFCPSSTGVGSLITKFGISLSNAQTAAGFTLPGSPTQSDYDRLCARLLMRWVLGSDLFDTNGNGNYLEVRQQVLGDIFHSSPVIVESPTDAFLCNLGLSNQCIRTLYATSGELGTAATPAPSVAVSTPPCGITNLAPYDAYAVEQRKRDKVVLVGANDGMVHAFVGGSFVSETCVGGLPVPTFNRGSGDEAWAFIPPDLLPKLADSVLSHAYMVDGDIMVRDIWADTSANGQKEKGEFHTLAVVSEGRGGKHYLGLEIKYTSGTAVLDRPGFQWMFPQPCSEEAATFGKTLFALSPKPPPIGPVLISATALPAASSIATAPPVVRNGVDTHERWVVALSGGWSPGLEKGRGIYVVDAWDGAINGRRDNLWWKFEFDESASGLLGPARSLTQSVPGPVAMVDYGTNDNPIQDGFFDTSIFGDTAGQIWVTRMDAPGTFSSSTKMIDNWGGGRAFEMDRDGVPGGAVSSVLPDGGIEIPDPLAKSIANKSPFYYLPSVGVEPGSNKMRVFAGTGNRYALLEGGAGLCRFDNMAACSKSKCDDDPVTSRFKDDIVSIDKMHTHWKNRRFEHGKLDETVNIGPTAVLTAANTCGSAGNKEVEASNETYQVGTCNYTSGVDPTPGKVNESKYECGLDSTGNSFTCTLKSETRILGDLLDKNLVDTTGLGNNRYVGFWAYGGTGSDGGQRVFGGSSGISALVYDSARFSDRSTASPGSGDLVNVTSVGCDSAGVCDGGATSGSNGWFIDYGSLDQKTAAGSAILASCVLWSDLKPSGGDAGVCGGNVSPQSRLYQADFLTGQPNCAYGFLATDGGGYARSQTRTVVAPPAEPAAVVQISVSGEVRYSAAVLPPTASGGGSFVSVAGGQDILQLVYELPLSRSLHNCRHADGGCATTP